MDTSITAPSCIMCVCMCVGNLETCSFIIFLVNGGRLLTTATIPRYIRSPENIHCTAESWYCHQCLPFSCPLPGNHYSALCFQEFNHFSFYRKVRSCSICLLVWFISPTKYCWRILFILQQNR